jgi:hypothetical protein
VADVFLSYAKEDHARARTFAGLLESCGWTVFWDHKIAVGDDWRQVVQAEIDRAGAVVVLWTQASVSSSWVQEEAERGRDRLVSVLLDEVPLPIGFSRAQGVNLIGWRGGRADGVDKLVEAVAGIGQVPRIHPPRIPTSPVRKRAIAAALAIGVAAAASIPISRWMRKPPPIMNQEIVLDTSSGMSAAFDTRPSKLAAAVEALRGRNLHPAENLALRAFGGACGEDEESRLLVPFGTNRRARIVQTAGDLTPGGKPTLVSGVISALSDLHPMPHARRIVVITGHADACYEEAIRELKQRVDAQPAAPDGKQAVALEMRFIGLALSPADQSRVSALSSAVGGQHYFVDTVAELNNVLEYVLEFEPAVTHVKHVWNVMEEMRKSMNGVAENANSRKFDEAERILKAGEASYDSLQASFDALAGVKISVKFQQFYDLAGQNRVLERELFPAGRELIRVGAAIGDPQSAGYKERLEAWNGAVAKWNEIIGRINTNVNAMNRLTEEIVKETRRAA